MENAQCLNFSGNAYAGPRKVIQPEVCSGIRCTKYIKRKKKAWCLRHRQSRDRSLELRSALIAMLQVKPWDLWYHDQEGIPITLHSFCPIFISTSLFMLLPCPLFFLSVELFFNISVLSPSAVLCICSCQFPCNTSRKFVCCSCVPSREPPGLRHAFLWAVHDECNSRRNFFFLIHAAWSFQKIPDSEVFHKL